MYRSFPALLLVFLLTGCQKKESPNALAMMMAQAVPVRTVIAAQSDVPLQFAAVGTVEAIASVDVKSRVAGQVLRVFFQEGQNITRGELLFQIDPEPLNLQITQIKADLAKDAALQQQAQANVSKDEAQLKQTKGQAERGLELQKEGIFSREQTEQVVASNDSALAALAADKAAVDSAEAAAKSDQARLQQTSLQLEYTKITAPISGRAGAIGVKAGNLVKDNDAVLVTLLQISPIYVTFGAPEQLLPEVQKFNAQKTMEVSASSGGKTLTGKLSFIDNTVDTTTGTIKLKALFENAGNTLWPGQFVDVEARLQVQHDRVTLPSRTLQTGPQGKYVWMLNGADNTVTMRPVTVDRVFKPEQGAEMAVMDSGVKPGDVVVSEGQMRLMPGAKVKILDGEKRLGTADTAASAGQS